MTEVLDLSALLDCSVPSSYLDVEETSGTWDQWILFRVFLKQEDASRALIYIN